MGNVGKDAAFLDFDLPLHAEQFEENLHTGLSRENLRDYSPDSAERPLEHLHLAAYLDLRADFHRFRIHNNLAQGFDNILAHNGGDASKLDDMGNPMAGPQVTMLAAVVEAREQITRKHRLGNPHSTTPPRPLKTKHGTKHLRADIPQNAALGGGFLPRLAFNAKPLQLIIFKIVH